MGLPSVSVINFSDRPDQDVQDAIRAVNRQITGDFMPIWGTGRELVLHAASFDPAHPDSLAEEPVRGSAVLYLVNESTLPGALGYHDMNAREIPVGFVFMTDDDWTITLSHEALELIVDPTVNIFVPGPHPHEPDRWLWHSYEVCDAVERTVYEIDGVLVSNFLTPEYFREGNAPGTRNDFLGVGVASFAVTEGSHLGVIDSQTYDWEIIRGRGGELMGRQSARCTAFGHAKPGRPEDKTLLSILREYNNEPAKGCKGLPQLRGITRTARYSRAAELVRKAGQKTAKGGI